MSNRLRTPGTSRLRSVGATRPEPAAIAPARVAEAAAAPTLLDRYAESVFGMPPWMLQARLSDFSRGGLGVALGVATGTPTDRKGGRDVPRFWSEIDLRGYRVLARHVTESNPFGIGFLGTLTDYHVRKGYGWQACRRGAKKSPYPTPAAPADPLVEKAQRVLDDFRNAAKWPLKSRESFRRWVRDGEVLGRWFHGGQGRLPEFRFGEPDCLGSPTGNTDGDDSFGVATPADDPQGAPIEFHFFDPDGVKGEWVAADRVTFAKRGTDTGVKRGITDFQPVAQDLEDCTKLVRAMMATAIRQAGTAWIEKYPGRAVYQVAGAVPEFAPATGYGGQARAPFESGVPWWLMPQFGGGLNPWEPPGVVRKVEGDREYQPGPTSTGVPGYVQAEQAALRGCGVIWRCPEYFTGDASNNNMASLIVAGSPFTICVESNQFEWGAVWERECALKVLDLAVLAGLLTRDERRALDVETTEPAVVVSDPGKDYQTTSQQLRDKVICLDTARQKSGYDPQHEAEGVKKDAAAEPHQPPNPGPGEPPANPPGGGQDLDGLFGESKGGAGAAGGTFPHGAGAVLLLSESEYAALSEADRAGLVKKTITNKANHTQTVWVRPDDATRAKPVAAADAAPVRDGGGGQAPAPDTSPHERRARQAAAAEHFAATAKERAQPKPLAAARHFADVARRRRVIHAVKNEGEVAAAIGGHNLPDSEPADVVHIVDQTGTPITDRDGVRAALRQREAAAKTLVTGKGHTIGPSGGLVASDRDATDEHKAFAQAVLARPAHFFEVKTLLTSTTGAVRMSKKALARKERWMDRFHVSFSVVALDDRRGSKNSGHRVYVAPHELGQTTRIEHMKPVHVGELLKAVSS